MKRMSPSILIIEEEKSNLKLPFSKNRMETHRASFKEFLSFDFSDFPYDLVLISSCISIEQLEKAQSLVRQPFSSRRIGLIALLRLFTEKKHISLCKLGFDEVLPRSSSSKLLEVKIQRIIENKKVYDFLRASNYRLKELSMTDDLTGLANMRCFNRAFLKATRSYRETGAVLGLLMIDLDSFKAINDRFSHLFGSFVIAEVGKRISKVCKKVPQVLAARYGGDEFIVLFSDLSLQKCRDLTRQMYDHIRSEIFVKLSLTCTVTGSFGLVYLKKPGFDHDEDIIKAADYLCYESKRSGKDQISELPDLTRENFDYLSSNFKGLDLQARLIA